MPFEIMNMRYVVSDTNIFIGLIEAGLLDEFFHLPWEVHTTDFVLYELTDERQRKQVDVYRELKTLLVKIYSADEFYQMIDFKEKLKYGNNLSIPDCSVWQLAQELCCPLLMGDKKLSTLARESVEVHGILYVFDNIVKSKLISVETAISRLKRLLDINVRLPRSKTEETIQKWLNDNYNN